LAQAIDLQLQDSLAGPLPAAHAVFFLLQLARLDEAFPVEPPQEVGGRGVQLRLRGCEPDLRMMGPAGRQVEVVDDARAPGAPRPRSPGPSGGAGSPGRACASARDRAR